MPGASVVVSHPEFKPGSRSHLLALIERMTDDDVEQLLAKATSLYTGSCYRKALQRRREMSTGEVKNPETIGPEFAYPSFDDARQHMRNLVGYVTGKTKPERVLIAKDLWVTQGYCMGVVVGEPSVSEAVTVKQLLVYAGDVDDKEAVSMLEQVSSCETPTENVNIHLKSLNAASFLLGTGAPLSARLARLLIPIIMRWSKDLLEDKFEELVRRVTT